jgi:ribosome-binding factor A
VNVSPDLEQAKVYVATIPDDEKTAVFLQEKSFFIQKLLNSRMKMKIVPKIRFVEEKQNAEAARIEEIIEKIHRQENG